MKILRSPLFALIVAVLVSLVIAGSVAATPKTADDGRFDPSFKDPFTYFNEDLEIYNDVQTVFAEPDGHVIVGGALRHKHLDPYTHDAFVRLNKHGRIVHRYPELTAYSDQRFAGEFNGLTIVSQTDRRILLGGFFSVGTNNVDGANIARLMPDGVTFDATFRATTDWGVGAVALQPNGKIIISGDFSVVNGETRRGMVRLEP